MRQPSAQQSWGVNLAKPQQSNFKFNSKLLNILNGKLLIHLEICDDKQKTEHEGSVFCLLSPS